MCISPPYIYQTLKYSFPKGISTPIQWRLERKNAELSNPLNELTAQFLFKYVFCRMR